MKRLAISSKSIGNLVDHDWLPFSFSFSLSFPLFQMTRQRQLIKCSNLRLGFLIQHTHATATALLGMMQLLKLAVNRDDWKPVCTPNERSNSGTI